MSIRALPIRLTYSALLRLVRVGRVHIDLGKAQLSGAGSIEGPSTHITVHRPWNILWHVVRSGGVGFAEAYMAGDWDSPDLPGTLRVLGLNLDARVRKQKLGPLITTVRKLWQSATSRKQPEIESIGDHYNLGNEFYEQWLDNTMTYSSAVFTEETKTLSDAQTEKYLRLAQLADIGPDDHVLEIGCGWGGFAEYAATTIGCRVTGLTLSTEQAEYARDRLKHARVDDRTDIKLLDFRMENGQYDSIVSIEMIESIPADLWPALFEAISTNLRPGGRVAMQAITIADDLYESLLNRDDFISKHIFPGGALPSLSALEHLANQSGLVMTEPSAYGPSYAETLRRWRERFEASWDNGHPGNLDERFWRTWRYYLAYCEAGFRIGRIDVHQVAFAS